MTADTTLFALGIFLAGMLVGCVLALLATAVDIRRREWERQESGPRPARCDRKILARIGAALFLVGCPAPQPVSLYTDASVRCWQADGDLYCECACSACGAPSPALVVSR